MSDDIVARLRVWIDQAKQQGVDEAVKGLTIAADTIERLDSKAFSLEYEIERLRAGGCARGQTTTQFCAEAEQLRAERDEARRAVCCSALPLDYKQWKAEDVDAALRLIAAQQGWDCFDENAARCGDGGPGAHTAGPTETFIPEAL